MIFVLGIDLSDFDGLVNIVQSEMDVGRKALHARNVIRTYQETFSIIEKVSFTVEKISNLKCMHTTAMQQGSISSAGYLQAIIKFT